MRIHIASDHAGVDLKSAVIEHLRKEGYDVIDHGAHSYDPDDDYPAFCLACGEAVVADAGSLGIVLGGSGNGEQIAANKVPGVRAATAHDLLTVRGSVENYDAQILCMGQNVIAAPAAWALVDIWLDLRHDPTSSYGPKVGEIEAYEAARPSFKPRTLPAKFLPKQEVLSARD